LEALYCLEAFYLPATFAWLAMVGLVTLQITIKIYFEPFRKSKIKILPCTKTLDIKQSKRVNRNFTCIFLLVIILWQS